MSIENTLKNLIKDKVRNEVGDLFESDSHEKRTVSSFTSYFAQGGDLSKSNFFDVYIQVPTELAQQTGMTSRELSIQCDIAELPGKNIDTLTIRHNNFIDRVPSDILYPEVSLGFICRGDLLEKKLFDLWLNKMISSDERDPYYGFAKYKITGDASTNFFTEVHINQRYQLETDEIASKIVLIDAMPISMSTMPLNWADDSAHKLTVTFAYRRWEDRTIDKTFLQAAEGADRLLPGTSILEKVRNVVDIVHATKVLKKLF